MTVQGILSACNTGYTKIQNRKMAGMKELASFRTENLAMGKLYIKHSEQFYKPTPIQYTKMLFCK